jgi:hypothetical protein
MGTGYTAYCCSYSITLHIYIRFLPLNNNDNNSILYFNVLTQQLQEPITESAQEDKYIHSKENNNNNNNNNNNKDSIQLNS